VRRRNGSVQKGRLRAEGGQVAVLGVFLILLFSAYGFVRVMSVAEEGSSLSHGVRAAAALYGAETGLEYAIEEIRAGKPDAGNIEGLVVGDVEVEVTNLDDTLLVAVAHTEQPSLSKTVRLGIEVSPLPGAFRYALYVGDEKNLTLNREVTIVNDILFDGKNLTLGKKLVLSNTSVYAPRSASVKNNSGSPIIRHNYMFENEPADDFPALTLTYYRSYIDNVRGYESVGPVIDVPADLADYTDRVIYREGDLALRAAVTGPGIIAAERDIFLEAGAAVGPDVHIIAGRDLEISEAVVTSGATTGSILFAIRRILIDDGSVLAASVLTPGDLSFEGATVHRGLCYTCGTATLDGSFDIRGSVVAWKLSGFDGTGSLRFDEVPLDVSGIPGLRGRPAVRRVAWTEE
jgi:hypothetical protein